LVNSRKLNAIIRTSASVGAMRRSRCRPRRSRVYMRTTSSWPPRSTACSLARPRRERGSTCPEICRIGSYKSLYQNQIQQPAAIASLGQNWNRGYSSGQCPLILSKSGRWPASYETRPPSKTVLLQFWRTVVWLARNKTPVLW
jgi:hypothetical protein